MSGVLSERDLERMRAYAESAAGWGHGDKSEDELLQRIWNLAGDVGKLVELAGKRGLSLQVIRAAAKNARSQAAAPDYDEEAIREALWAVVAAAREVNEPAGGRDRSPTESNTARHGSSQRTHASAGSLTSPLQALERLHSAVAAHLADDTGDLTELSFAMTDAALALAAQPREADWRESDVVKAARAALLEYAECAAGSHTKPEMIALLKGVLEERDFIGDWLQRCLDDALSNDDIEAIRHLANEAAIAVCEPRRFHENEDGRQWKLAQAVARVRGLSSLSPTSAAGDERRHPEHDSPLETGRDDGCARSTPDDHPCDPVPDGDGTATCSECGRTANWPEPRFWLIHFEDAGRGVEVFNDETAARARSEQVGLAWNHTLFVQARESRQA